MVIYSPIAYRLRSIAADCGSGFWKASPVTITTKKATERNFNMILENMTGKVDSNIFSAQPRGMKECGYKCSTYTISGPNKLRSTSGSSLLLQPVEAPAQPLLQEKASTRYNRQLLQIGCLAISTDRWSRIRVRHKSL